MGTYASTTTLKIAFPGFPQSSSSFDTMLDSNITRAEAVINSFVSRRYGLPFVSSIPPIIKSLAEDLSAGYVYRSSFMRDSHNTSEWQTALVKDAMELLTDIRDRKIDLVDTSGNLIGERSERDRVKSNTEDYAQIFNVDTSTAWAVDPDRISDIADDRL